MPAYFALLILLSTCLLSLRGTFEICWLAVPALLPTYSIFCVSTELMDGNTDSIWNATFHKWHGSYNRKASYTVQPSSIKQVSESAKPTLSKGQSAKANNIFMQDQVNIRGIVTLGYMIRYCSWQTVARTLVAVGDRKRLLKKTLYYVTVYFNHEIIQRQHMQKGT